MDVVQVALKGTLNQPKALKLFRAYLPLQNRPTALVGSSLFPSWNLARFSVNLNSTNEKKVLNFPSIVNSQKGPTGPSSFHDHFVNKFC